MPEISDPIVAAKGDVDVDLLISNCRIINLFSGTIKKDNIAIFKGQIVGFGDYPAKKIIDARERYVAPGFIDGHVHIESSMLNPVCFAEAIVRRGTTAVIADPHEIVNVLGLEGLQTFLDCTIDLPVDFYFMMPSCVPATHLETAAYNITAKTMQAFQSENRMLGLGEMMNYPGVINRDSATLEKIKLYQDKIIDGHSPLLSGKELSAYMAAGITSDHECSSLEEAQEKLEKGMFILIREGSAAKNLEALLPLVTSYNSANFGFCTDDRHPDYLMEKGHIDNIINKAINLKMSPIRALQLSSLNIARHYQLPGRGGLGIGYQADLVLFDDLEDIKVQQVFKKGKLIVNEGKLVTGFYQQPHKFKNSIHIKDLSEDRFTIPAKTGKVKVIQTIPDQILTRQTTAVLPQARHNLQVDPEHDILKLAVVERHKNTGNIQTAFVKGFGLKKGAICSTVAHDSHNLIILGTNDADMHHCVEIIREMKGGLAIVVDGKKIAALPLPFAGLMSDKSLAEVYRDYLKLLQAAREYGCIMDDPFMSLSFLALPVIPELKLTDKGLVDVNRFDFTSLYETD